MTGYLVTLLAVAMVTVTVVKETQAACCKSVERGWCADCTETTPYCGYGKCNIFGCACDGGCRKNCGATYSGYHYSFWSGGRYSYCTCTKTKRSAEAQQEEENPTENAELRNILELENPEFGG